MDFIMYAAAIVAVAIVVFMLIKKMDIKITMLAMGVMLIAVAMFMGKDLYAETTTGLSLLDPIQQITDQFKSTLSSSGFIILILGGYAAYMSAIGANEVTVSVLTKPMGKIKSVYVLAAVVFLVGNCLSLVVPSAANLAVILLATLYPVLKKANMSTLTAAGIIATTATVMPTPLGGDNIAIAAELAQTTQFAGMTAADYVFNYHSRVSVPTLLVMALTHFVWQKYQDKKNPEVASAEVEVTEVKEIQGGLLYKTVYAILPLLPIVLLLAQYSAATFAGVSITLGVEVAAFVSFIIALLCEIIRNKGMKVALDGTEAFFKGMGDSMGVVALLVAASIFVAGLNAIGLISTLQTTMLGLESGGAVLPLILVLFTALIVLLSGSGVALFYAMVPLMVGLAAAAGINVLAVSVPMGLAGNLLRAVSPVSGVVVIVAGATKVSPMEIVKRTSVPMIVGVVFMFIMSMAMFLPMGI